MRCGGRTTFPRFPRSRRPWRHGLAGGDRPERRADPRGLWPDVRSVIMLGVNYGPDEDPLAILERRTRGAISVYAQGDDYHDLIKKRLKALARWLVAASGCEVKVFVDTAAVMEKPLAQAAGLGWQGKHTNLVSREFGSWLFLGAIFTTLELPRDEAESRSLRLLPGLPRHLPDRGVSRALQARCAALHFLSHHREQGADPARIPQGDRQPHLWLRRLPRGLPVEQIRASRARGQTRRARRIARARSRRTGAARRCRVSRPVRQIAGQAHRPRPFRPQRADRDRQLERPRLAAEAERLLDDESPLVRGAAVWALSQLLAREEFADCGGGVALRRAMMTDARTSRSCVSGMAGSDTAWRMPASTP